MKNGKAEKRRKKKRREKKRREKNGGSKNGRVGKSEETNGGFVG